MAESSEPVLPTNGQSGSMMEMDQSKMNETIVQSTQMEPNEFLPSKISFDPPLFGGTAKDLVIRPNSDISIQPTIQSKTKANSDGVPCKISFDQPLFGGIWSSDISSRQTIRSKTKATSHVSTEANKSLRVEFIDSGHKADTNHTKSDHNKVAPCDEGKSLMGEDQNYRFSKEDLKTVLNRKLQHIKTTDIVGYASRLCVFKDQLWVSRYTDKSLQAISMDGTLQRAIQLDYNELPYALDSVRPDELVLAAGSGLYILDCYGRMKEKLQQGYFSDVHVQQHTMAALDRWKNIVYIWGISDGNCQPKNCFPVQLNSNHWNNTVLLSQSHLYVGDFENDRIHKYSLAGDHIGHFDMATAGLDNPRLCMCDNQSNLLITDYSSSSVIVLSDSGSVTDRLEIQGHPMDALIIGDIFCVLLNYSKIAFYKLN